MKKNLGKMDVNFAEAPALGTKIFFGRSDVVLTLVAIRPYVRRDGGRSLVMDWDASDGRKATSPLRGNSISWVAQEENTK